MFDGYLRLWPIVMIVRTYGSCRKNIENFVFLTSQRKIGQGVYILSYLLNISMKSLLSFFCWKGNIPSYRKLTLKKIYALGNSRQGNSRQGN